MCSLFAKRIISSSLFQNHYLPLLNPLLRLSLSTQNQKENELASISEYLISSLGFSSEQAIKVSSNRKLSKISSLTGPQSVVHFLKEIGMSDAQIRSVVSFNPNLLSCNVDETLKPKLEQLMAAGFRDEILVDLIRYSPFVFQAENPIARLQFWREFVGDSAFPKLVRRNGLLIIRDVGRCATPILDFLKEYGLSNEDISKLFTEAVSKFIVLSLDNIHKKLKQTEEQGFSPKSNMFIYGLIVNICHKKETIDKKSQFFQNMYGWSEEDVRLASVKFPTIMSRSEGKVKAAMNFLINSAGLEPRSIVSQPMLLGYSLEKTLIPRHRVMSILKSHGLMKEDYRLLNLCVSSEKNFFKKFIVPHEKVVPGLADAYADACSGKDPH